MENESFEATLLRMVIGYLQYSQMQLLAHSTFGKPLHTLDDDQRARLLDQILQEVRGFADALTPEMLRKRPSGITPSGPIQ